MPTFNQLIHDIFAHIPGERSYFAGTILIVLVRGGRVKRFARCEIPSYSRSQGFVWEFRIAEGARSKYGAERPKSK
uniref:Ribosomal protein S12 n=1 Tax=Phoenix dactylifera TaxID=42345 RepID=A0A2R4FZG5_PHODC|nr:ribosomal protein S12 [Phoenix dactylifera]